MAATSKIIKTLIAMILFSNLIMLFARGEFAFNWGVNHLEVQTAFTYESAVVEIKHDPLIPGNMLLVTYQGVVTTDGNTTETLTTTAAESIVIIDREITLSVHSEHCLEQFTRTNPHENTTPERVGQCSVNGLASGALDNNTMFDKPLGLLVIQEGKQILLADRVNHRIRTIDTRNKTIDQGIYSAKRPYSFCEHPSDPDKILVSVRGGIALFRLSDRTIIMIIGGSGSGFVDGSMSEARFSKLIGMQVINGEDLLVADSGNDAIRYISNIRNADPTVETICRPNDGETVVNTDGNFTECRVSNPRQFLFDGSRLMFGTLDQIRFIGAIPFTTVYQHYRGKPKIFSKSSGNAACSSDLSTMPVIQSSSLPHCFISCLKTQGCVGVHRRDNLCGIMTQVAMASGGNPTGECFVLHSK